MRRRILVIGVLAVVVAGVATGVLAPGSSRRHAAPRAVPALAPGGVSLVGDSLNVGIEPYLRELLGERAFTADDVVGRPTAVGLEHLRAGAASLGRYVVVSLGTNDPVESADAFRAGLAEAVRLVGSRCLVWATIHRDGDAYAGFNAILRAQAARTRNLRLVDWSAMVDAHPDWLGPDGIHAGPEGYRARAQAVLDAMRTCP